MEKELDLTVSPNNLLESWTTLPEDIKVWNSAMADALEAQYKAENKLELVKAQVSINIRKNPQDYGFPKVTEDQIKALVINDKGVQEAEDALLAAKVEVKQLQAIIESLDVKRSALKYLSELTVTGYVGSRDSFPSTLKSTGGK